MKIYIYGIIDLQGVADRLLRGLEGCPVYTIPYRDIGAAASDFHFENRAGSAAVRVDHILRHETVVEKLAENQTVLPVRFLTTYDTNENVLAMMRAYYPEFKKNLDRLRDKVEFGLKVIWRGEETKKSIIDAYHTDSRVSVPDNSPLQDYMMKKYRQYEIQNRFEEEAENSISAIDGFFSPFACEKRLERLKTDNLLLDAYYLIEKENQVDFKSSFERLKMDLGNFRYLLSGPWPPYNFILLEKKADLLGNLVRVPTPCALDQKDHSSGRVGRMFVAGQEKR